MSPTAESWLSRIAADCRRIADKPIQALSAVMRKMLMAAWVLTKTRQTYGRARLYAAMES